MGGEGVPDLGKDLITSTIVKDPGYKLRYIEAVGEQESEERPCFYTSA